MGTVDKAYRAEDKRMSTIIPRYLQSRFLKLFAFCLLCVVLVFFVVDLVENVDRFIDREVPHKVVLLYYLYYIPYIIVITMPVATLLAVVFSVGSLARHNEMVALKSLGYSLYRVMRTLLGLGVVVSIASFIMAETMVVHASRKREDIRRSHMEGARGKVTSRLRNLEIQEPPDKVVTIGYFDGMTNVARQVKIETFRGARLVSRLDSPSMQWDGEAWLVSEGYFRMFDADSEKAFPVRRQVRYFFQFDPEELVMAQVKPDEMGILELSRFVERVRRLGGEVHRWMTDLHLRIAFPLSNLIVVLFSAPIAYNRRKKSLVVGFGISLVICFFYFGLLKIGETMGQKGNIHPFLAAWLGNDAMGIGGIINLIKTRK